MIIRSCYHSFSTLWWLSGIIVSLALSGCGPDIEPAAPRPESADIDRSMLELDVPPILRGTIASEAVMVGYEPVVVRGYGLVVGLNGTGSRDIPPSLRAHMLLEMSRRGIGSERTGWGHLKPEALLDSLDTAIVVVEGLIPPGSLGRWYSPRQWGESKQVVPGTPFDVRVYADPRTGTTSLEGGQLYTCELRPGPLTTGSRQAAALAEASGPIFVNPFSEPGSVQAEVITATIGRILHGGEVIENMPLKLQLFNPSHTRAAVLQNTINTKFPEEPMQGSKTAHGESDATIEISVPPSFKGNTDEFVKLLHYTTLRLAGAEANANFIRRSLLANPADAETAYWRWRALGNRALPIIRELYDHSEELPRLAALQAGAKLDDALVIPHLIDLTENTNSRNKLVAVNLLAEMGPNLVIDQALQKLLDEPDVETCLATYEALVKRGSHAIRRFHVDEHYIVDIVECDQSMVYITQQNQPRIALFGRALNIDRPITMQTWSNRLMIRENSEDFDKLDVYYRPHEEDPQGMIYTVSSSLPEFIYFLGHRSSIEQPDPGIGLSYGQTVGALHQIWSQGYLPVDFKAEQDRILAAIVAQEAGARIEDRPEFSERPVATPPAEDTSRPDF